MILKTISKHINEEVIFHEEVSNISYIKPRFMIEKLSDLDKYLSEIDLVVYDVSENEEDFNDVKIIYFTKDGIKQAEVTKNDIYLMNNQGQTIERIK